MHRPATGLSSCEMVFSGHASCSFQGIQRCPGQPTRGSCPCSVTPVLSGLLQPVSDWVVPSSNWHKSLEIQQQTCPVMSMWGDWTAFLSCWALQCPLWRPISTWAEAEGAGCCWRFASSCHPLSWPFSLARTLSYLPSAYCLLYSTVVRCCRR